MEDEQPDSLEGWVPVREDLFAKLERHQLRFLVAWNAAEGKFAVTCHDRTAQRRRRSEGSRPGSELGPEREAAAPLPSWTGLLSAAGLRGAHRQLAALWPPLERCFPLLPPGAGRERRWGLGSGFCGVGWSANLSGGGRTAGGSLQELCMRLPEGLNCWAEGCGDHNLGNEVIPEVYPSAKDGTGPWNKTRLKGSTSPGAVTGRQVLQGHEKANTMVTLMKVYQEEDEAYQELVLMATTFYQYLLQPFRDMREVATSRKLSILKSLDEDDLGPKRVVALQKEAKEWTRRAEEATVSIQDITVNYFKETVKALAGMQKQMEQDEKRFGQAAWAAATPRLEKLKLMLARESLQFMRAKELCLNHKRAEIRRKKMEDLLGKEKNIDVVDELEIQYYEVQLELYEAKLEMLKYEEILLITQLDSIKRLIKEKQDEVVYYDTCESLEELKVVDKVVGLPKDKNLEVKELSRQSQQLESKRGRICARRAYLRNKKDQCKENHRLRLQQAEESVKYFHQHHSTQMKRDKIKDEEQKKREWINQERQKTLQRLRAFKEKCPGRSVLKTSCSEPVTPSLPGELSQQTSPLASQTVSVMRLSSAKGRSSPSSKVSNVKSPRFEDWPGNTPVQIFVPVADHTHSKSSEELSPPPPLPALPFSSQSATHRNLHFRPSVKEDQPLPLVCESFPERPADYLHPRSMDAVLASLRNGKSPLQKVDVPTLAPPRTSVNEHILAAIRQGVKLKKVHPNLGLKPSHKPPSDLERSIKAALQRIKKVSTDSEEEDGSEQSPSEWDQ
uniref:WASP homolog associated with actin, golgi membranes and microtubules n=1 Tax=Loxodonta africana TaxID=9785 RepID=G3T606_LOXAF